MSLIISASDPRSYRSIKLENGLEALLIHDETAEMAGASLDVRSGHWKDPKTTQGLAHFCEHMLFLGTKKYPEEDGYSSFLTKHGGKYNAYTAAESTNYMFEVVAEHLDAVLDMFAQFFIEPLFTESGTAREVQAIDAEHNKNLQSDLWRMMRLNELLASPEHAQSKFGTGSSKTLEVHTDLREQVMNFWKDNYSANIMKLVVLGKEPLDELEASVRSKFSAIENKNLKPYDEKTMNGKPYAPESFGAILRAVPVSSVRRLVVNWPVRELTTLFRCKPDNYISHLIGHEGEGSVLSYLKAKGWAEALQAGGGGHPDFGLISVSIELSPAGAEHVDEILDVIYAYIALFKDHGISETLYKELNIISDLGFRFKDKEDVFGYVTSVATAMQLYPTEYFLYGSRVNDSFNKDLIQEVLNKLVPSNAIIAIYDSSLKKVEGQEPTEFTPNLVEEHYGIEYRIDKIKPEVQTRWEKILASKLDSLTATFPGLEIPLPNPFIPDDISILPPPKDIPADGFPLLIEDTPTTRLWHKQDQTFKRPKTMLFLDFQSPVTYNSPMTVVKTKLFIDYIAEELNEFGYDATVANLKYAVTSTLQGFTIAVSGYSCKQIILLEKLLSRFRTVKIQPERLQLLIDRATKTYQNMDFQPPYAQANYQLSLHLESPRWNFKQYQDALKMMTVECIQSWIPQCINALYAEILAIGNISADQAKDVTKLARDSLQFKALLPGQFQQLRYVHLTEGQQFWVQRYAPNPAETNCAVFNSYHATTGSLQDEVTMGLLTQLVETNAFDTLRTKEQLGYIVSALNRVNNGVSTFNVVVQSPTADPVHLDSRIEAWIATVHDYLVALPQEEFEQHRKSMIAVLREKPTSLRKEALRYWTSIAHPHLYEFDESEQQAKHLEKLTKEEVIALWDAYVAPGAAKRAKFSTQNWAKPHEIFVPAAAGSAAPITVVKDPFLFKGRMPLHAVPTMGKERMTTAEFEAAVAAEK